MENAQKALMIGVALFVAILLITGFVRIMSIGVSAVEKGNSGFNNSIVNLSESEVSKYNNTYLNGSDVVAAVQKYYSSKGLIIYLNTTSKLTYVCVTQYKFPHINNISNYGLDYYKPISNDLKVEKNSSSNRPSYSDFTDVSSDYYINSNQTYKSYLIRSYSGDSIMGIIFVKI